ncbi:MAG: ATP-dependent helicase [Lachnospiraceae bacterium]|nr:ATP-dependent helicase [Lachnospiraceae bacterium]
MTVFNNEQLRAVKHRDGPMLVLAGPGSGKTRVITGRVQRLIREEGTYPSGILVLTFSKAAALTMSSRFQNEAGTAYPVTFGTFHAIFYHILKRQGLYKTGTILTRKRKSQLLKITAMRLNILRCSDPCWIERMLTLIGIKKAGLLDSYVEMTKEEEEKLELIFEPYVSICRKENGIDFDDMINECLKELKSNDKILKKWQDKYRYILVDEFQDIDSRQYEVLKLLAGKRRNLFCVGDDDQSIYSFRGACPDIMKRLLEDFPETDVCSLKVNYRCPKNVIEHADRLIRHNGSRLSKSQECNDIKTGCIEFKSVNSSEDEARLCLEIIRSVTGKASGDHKSTGVLYRTQGSADMLENLLNKAMIPYVRRDGAGNMHVSEWVADIAAYLRLAVNGSEDDLLRILNRPDRGLTRECVHGRFPDRDLISGYYPEGSDEQLKCRRLFKDIDRISTLNGFGAVNYILKVIGLGGYIKETYFQGSKEGEYENEVEGIIRKARDHDSLRMFSESIEGPAVKRSEPDVKSQAEDDCVELMTIHASKGLEFDNVIMIGLQEGLFPGKRCESTAELEEERRLFYVAMTRCRHNLYIIGLNKDNYGKRQSRFITEAGFAHETVEVFT